VCAEQNGTAASQACTPASQPVGTVLEHWQLSLASPSPPLTPSTPSVSRAVGVCGWLVGAELSGGLCAVLFGQQGADGRPILRARKRGCCTAC
jgi:hypothetical protein